MAFQIEREKDAFIVVVVIAGAVVLIEANRVPIATQRNKKSNKTKQVGRVTTASSSIEFIEVIK